MWEGCKVAVPSALGWDRVDPNVECGKRTVSRAGLLERRAELGRGTVEPVEPATASTATWRSAPDPRSAEAGRGRLRQQTAGLGTTSLGYDVADALIRRSAGADRIRGLRGVHAGQL